MKDRIKKYWPSVAHVAAIAVIFLDASVKAYFASHPAMAAVGAVAWGVALHWAESPKENPASKF